MMHTDLSIVIPLKDEAESLPELTEWIVRVVTGMGITYEVIFVDDGSKDASWDIILGLKSQNTNIHGIRFRRNYGKSAALNEGFALANGRVVITMDADLQDSPDEIPALYDMILIDGYDIVSGYKKVRHDPLSKTIPTKLFNWVTRKLSGINNLHDFNCGLKAYHGDVVKNIEVYGEMHRYIPLLAKWAGFSKITEKVVEHRPRKYGSTKFGLERFVNGFLDLLSINFTLKFSKKPMHFFGTIGLFFFISGFAVAAYLIAEKLWKLANLEPAREITDQPLFYIALTTVIVGTQLFLTGFIADMISRNAQDRNQYGVKEKI
jgi:glycosyltransferase involved in cell wall biosynthesis